MAGNSASQGDARTTLAGQRRSGAEHDTTLLDRLGAVQNGAAAKDQAGHGPTALEQRHLQLLSEGEPVLREGVCPASMASGQMLRQVDAPMPDC